MKTRVLSAIVMVALFVPLFILGGNYFNVFVSLISVLALRELIRAKGDDYPLILIIISYIASFGLTFNYNLDKLSYLIDYRLIILFIALVLVITFFYRRRENFNIISAFYLIGSVLFLVFPLRFLINLRKERMAYDIYLLLIAIFTDTFAYFTGRLIGKKKLAPEISPNKTIEGSIGGTVAAIIFCSNLYLVAINPNMNIVYVVLMTLILSIMGQLGDLIFSYIKREFNLKDYSKLLPGHGGVLDRIDSLLFIIITFSLFTYII